VIYGYEAAQVAVSVASGIAERGRPVYVLQGLGIDRREIIAEAGRIRDRSKIAVVVGLAGDEWTASDVERVAPALAAADHAFCTSEVACGQALSLIQSIASPPPAPVRARRGYRRVA
jgi:hypothetical protein